MTAAKITCAPRIEIRDGERWADPFAVQDSSMLRTLADADALVIRGSPTLMRLFAAGSMVQIPFSWKRETGETAIRN